MVPFVKLRPMGIHDINRTGTVFPGFPPDSLIVLVVFASTGNLRAVEPLIPVLSDRDVRVRERALRALRIITGQIWKEDPAQWRNWWETYGKKSLK